MLNNTHPPASYTLSLHDALPIYREDEPRVVAQVAIRGGLDVSRVERRVAREVLREIVRPAGVELVRVQLIGHAAESADALEAVVESGFDLVDGALELPGRRRVAI